jgi:predicted PurR-regulated permease PerM
MAADARNQIVDQLVQQGQAMVQSIVSVMQQNILAAVQTVLGQLSQLTASLGGRVDFFQTILAQFQQVAQQLLGNLSGSLLGSIQTLIGGGARIDLMQIFNDFVQQITPHITGLGQHFLNQGLSAVLGAIGGARGLGDIFGGLAAQIGTIVAAGQTAAQGILSQLSGIVGGVIDASKPHLETLQEQLVGHGLNALNSLAESIQSLHGSVIGGR